MIGGAPISSSPISSGPLYIRDGSLEVFMFTLKFNKVLTFTLNLAKG